MRHDRMSQMPLRILNQTHLTIGPVYKMDHHHRPRHIARIAYGCHNPTNALHAPKTLDRQAQSHRRLRAKTPVSIVLSSLLPNQEFNHQLTLSNVQHHPHRHLPPPLLAIPPLNLKPFPRPHHPHSLDAGRNGLQPRHSSHTHPHALPGENEHGPRSLLARRLHSTNHGSRILLRRRRQQLRDAVAQDFSGRQSGT